MQVRASRAEHERRRSRRRRCALDDRDGQDVGHCAAVATARGPDPKGLADRGHVGGAGGGGTCPARPAATARELERDDHEVSDSVPGPRSPTATTRPAASWPPGKEGRVQPASDHRRVEVTSGDGEQVMSAKPPSLNSISGPSSHLTCPGRVYSGADASVALSRPVVAEVSIPTVCDGLGKRISLLTFLGAW